MQGTNPRPHGKSEVRWGLRTQMILTPVPGVHCLDSKNAISLGAYISYPLLCNKLSHILVVSNNLFITHSFYGSESWKWLNLGPLLQHIWQVCNGSVGPESVVTSESSTGAGSISHSLIWSLAGFNASRVVGLRASVPHWLLGNCWLLTRSHF